MINNWSIILQQCNKVFEQAGVALGMNRIEFHWESTVEAHLNL